MKKFLLIPFILFSLGTLSAQSDMTIEQLKAKQSELSTKANAAQKEADAAKKEAEKLQKEINALSGWMTGFTGLVGVDLGGSNSWIANPNPTSSNLGLSVGLTAFANREQPKYFWNNKLIANKAWQRVVIGDASATPNSDLFDNGTVDILNVSSLAGYKLSDKLALSALGELNSSIENFLAPGTFDIGVGATWRPITNLTVVVHPLNYHIAWSAQNNLSSQAALGAKLRADYQNNFLVAGRKIAWSTTLTSFLPYSNKTTLIQDVNRFGVPITDPITGEIRTRDAGLLNWTWLNTFSFQVLKGIGVGVNFGLRGASFEYDGVQTFYGIGATYTL